MQQSKPWERDWSQPTTPTPPVQQAPQSIQIKPAPRPDPAELQRLEMERQRLAIAQAGEVRDQQKLQTEASDKLRKATDAKASAISSITGVLNKIDAIERDAMDNGGWGETGFTGTVMRMVPGSPAYDLAENLKTIDANSAFSALQEMRNNSPTGGALGQVTEKELDLLKSSIANLNPGQSQQQFLTNLREARQRYADILKRLNPEAAKPEGSQQLARQQTNSPVTDGIEYLAGMRPAGFEVTSPDGEVTFTYPDGRTKKVQASDLPDDFQAQDAFREQYRAKYGEDPPLFIRITDDSGAPPPPDTSGRDTFWGGVDAIGRGAADVATFGLADELAAAVDTVFGGGTMEENLNRQRGIDRADEQVNPIARFGGQMGGALATAAITPAWMRPTTGKGFAGAGALSGGAYGYGSGEGGPLSGDRLQNALLGTAAGAATGYGFGKVGQKLAERSTLRAERRTAEQGQRNALLQAADRQGVEMMPADVGGPMTRRLTAGAAQAPVSAGPIMRAGQRVQDQTRAARDRIAEGAGEVLDPETAGEIARRGGDKFIQYTRNVGGNLYDRAERMARDAKVMPRKALAALDDAIGRMRQNPAAEDSAQLNALEKLRDRLGKGAVSVVGVRDMRTKLREAYMDEGLRSNGFQKIIKDVVDAASEDMADGLAEQGLERAVAAFSTADRYWRGRVEMIDQFLAPILGRNRSGEEVMRALEGAAKSRGRQLSGFVRALPEQERRSVQATVISRLGAKRGDAEAVDFSSDVFLTQWKAMTPRAKTALFDKETRSALDDLARIAEGSKAANAYANRSNTSGGIAAQFVLSGGAMTGGPLSLAFATIGQYGAGKLLASPGVARWLARAPKAGSNPTAIRTWANRFPIAAGNTPAIREQMQAFQRQLIEGLSQGPGRVAASGPDTGDGRGNGSEEVPQR